MAGYDDLSYAELQAACKKRGLPARGKKVDMIAALEEADGAGSKKGRKAAPPVTERSLLHSASRVPLPREAAATTARSRRSAAAAPSTPAPRTMARAGSRGGSGRRRGSGASDRSRAAAAAAGALVPVAAALLLAAAALGGAARYTETGGRVYDAAAAAAAPAIAAVSENAAAAAAAAGRVAAPAVAALEPVASALSPALAPLTSAAGAVKSAGFTASKTMRRQASVAWETAAAAGASAWDTAGSAGGAVGGRAAGALAALKAAAAAPALPSPRALLGRLTAGLAGLAGGGASSAAAAPPGPACGPALAADLVPTIAADGPAWAGARAALADAIATHGAAGGPPAPGDQPKATAVLLAGWDPVALGAAALAVAEAAPGAGPCAGCVLTVQPEDVSSSADLQAAAAPFLARCPGGVIALPRAHELPAAAAPALLALLGERGAFELDGSPVPTAGALVVLSAAAPPSLRGRTDEAALSAGAKAALGSALAGDGPGADGLAAALRRRIDIVVPLRE